MTTLLLLSIFLILLVIIFLLSREIYRNQDRQIENLKAQLKAQNEIQRNENGELMKQIGLLTEASVKRMPARTVEYLEHSQYESLALLDEMNRDKIRLQGDISRIDRDMEHLEKIMGFMRTARTANNRKEKQL